MNIINDLQLLKEIKDSCYQGPDIRASWIGPNLPSTNVAEYKNIAKWALEHLRMYQGFYYELDKTKTYNILDIACGTGYNTNILSQEFPNSKIIGVDLDENCIKFANTHNKNSNIEFYVGNALEYKNNDKFDFIFCLETLEHILAINHFKLINNLLSCLNENGKLFLSTPNENTPDANSHHIGILNEKRFQQFSYFYKNNISSIKYYNNTKLLLENPLDFISEQSSSHYRIIIKK